MPPCAGCPQASIMKPGDRDQHPYFDLIKKITTISNSSSRNVLITSRIGTIASSLLLGGAIAGIGGGASFGAGGSAGTTNAGAGGGAAAACGGAAGGATLGSGGTAGTASGGTTNVGAAEAAGGAGGGAAGVLIAGFVPMALIMRVNSPGPESTGGGGGAGGAEVLGLAGTSARRFKSWVTPPPSGVDDGSAGFGGAYDGSGSDRYGVDSGCLELEGEPPDPASEDRMPVTLVAGCDGGADFSAGRKNGSFFHEVSSAGGRGGGGAGATDGTGVAGLEAPGAGDELKNCVNPPPADAESEVPGEENPLAFEGLAGGVGRGVSSLFGDG
jgi:hypothetical protein